jgi:uncharacterized repeat protein (TIGR03803 family)
MVAGTAHNLHEWQEVGSIAHILLHNLGPRKTLIRPASGTPPSPCCPDEVGRNVCNRVSFQPCAVGLTSDGSYCGGTVFGPLLFDQAGNIYGMTALGGKGGVGTVFKLSPGGLTRVWTLSSQ